MMESSKKFDKYKSPTVYLKNVSLKKFFISISVAGVVAHVGGGHLGDVQRAIIPKILEDTRGKMGNCKHLEKINQYADIMAEGKRVMVLMEIQPTYSAQIGLWK